jgi:hypothetical protein
LAIFSGIAAAVAAVGSAVAGVFTVAGAAAFALRTVAAIGLSLALNALAGKKQPEQQGFGVQGKIAGGGDVPRSFHMGLAATAGSLVYPGTWGQSGKTPNAYLTQVIALSDMPVAGLAEFWVNGAKVTVLWNEPRAPQGWPVQEYRKDGKDHCWIEFFDGTQTAASAFLVSTFGSAANPYEPTRVGRGVAYAAVTTLVADDLWTGWPTFRFVLNGLKLYDPSRDSTVGGSGSHRYDDPATWGGDGDHLPAVQIYNLFRGIRWNGDWLYGLQDLPAARAPVSAAIAAISKCRAETTGLSGTEPAYRAGGQFNVNVPMADAVSGLVTACHGRLAEIGGTYKLRCGAPDDPVITFDDGAILSSAEQSFTPFLGLAQTINGIAARYPSPADGWTSKVAPPLYRSDFEAADGGRRLMADLDFPLVPYGAQVQRLMSSALEEARRARRHTLVLPPEFFVLEPGDTVAWTSDRNFYEAKLFRVDGLVDRANLDVLVDVTEVDPADYDPPAAGYRPEPAGTISTVVPIAPQGIQDFDAQGITITAASGISKPGIRLFWNGTNIDDVTGVEFQIWDNALAAIVSQGVTAPSTVPVGRVDIDGGLVSATTYKVRARFVPGSGRATSWSSYITVTTPDVRVSQAALDAALQASVAKIDVIEQEARDLAKSISPNADIRDTVRGKFDTSLRDLVRDIGLSLGYVLTQFDRQADTMRDAGITVDPANGTVRIEAVDRLRTSTDTRFSQVTALFDGVNALIALRATKAELDNAVASVLNGFAPAYRWEFNGTAEGWAGSGATLTTGSGSITAAGTAAGAYLQSPTISFDAAANKVVELRVRRTAGSGWGLSLQYGGSYANSTAFAQPAVPTDWNVIRLDLSGQTGWTGTLTGLRLAVANGSTFEIDYITVGNSTAQDLIIGGLSARVSDLELSLDAANDAIVARATVIDLDTARGRITTAEDRLDAAEAAISQRVTNAVFDPVATRVTTAEARIDALQGQITLSIGAVQDKSPLIRDLALADAKGQIDAFLRGKATDEKLAYASQTLGAKVEDNGNSIATLNTNLIALSGSTDSRFAQEIAARADGDAALASRAAALEAAVNNPSTGLAAATARIGAEEAARASGDSALTTSLATQTSRIDGALSSIATLNATKVDASGAAVVAQQTLDAVFGAGSANVKMRLAALATPAGYDALFEVQASATGATGTFRTAGFRIGVLTVSGTQVAVIDFVADRFAIRRPGDGAVVLGWDTAASTLSLFNGTLIAGLIRNVAGSGWSFEIDLNYPRLRIRDPVTGNIVLVIGETS